MEENVKRLDERRLISHKKKRAVMVARAFQCKQNKTQKKGGTIFSNHQKEIVSIKKIFLTHPQPSPF